MRHSWNAPLVGFYNYIIYYIISVQFLQYKNAVFAIYFAKIIFYNEDNQKKGRYFKMKKLNLAIIGQGRSGKDIHGAYYRREDNQYYNVKYVVDADAHRRELAKENYPGCEVFADYRELFEIKDIDVVVNASYSEMHYSITKDLLAHGFSVLSEKPFGRTYYECMDLVRTAQRNQVTIAAFHQTLFTPAYRFVKETIESGKLGEIVCNNDTAYSYVRLTITDRSYDGHDYVAIGYITITGGVPSE
jgi:hypothetical protein